MRSRCRQGLVVAGLAWLATFPTTGARGERPSIMRQAQGAHVVIAEVQYDPAPDGSESRYEWVELFNPGDVPADIAGWHIADNQSTDALPGAVLAPGAFLVVAAGDGFAELFPDFAGAVVDVGGSIGNGLGNSGDQVRLLDADGTAIDAMSYGGDTGVLDPAAPDVEAGHSLERVPAGVDTDSAGDWHDAAAASPGFAGGAASPTHTALPRRRRRWRRAWTCGSTSTLPLPRRWTGMGTARPTGTTNGSSCSTPATRQSTSVGGTLTTSPAAAPRRSSSRLER